MARSRNVKPGFFSNDVLAELPALTRLLFIGIWTLADRDGRLEDRPKKIKAEALPYDECEPDAMLQALHEAGFILRYVSNGQRFIQVVTWQKHQNPHVKEHASTIPAPDLSGANAVAALVSIPEPSLSIPALTGMIPDSGFPVADSPVKAPVVDLAPAAKRKAKRPLPPEFGISDRVRKWAAGKGYDQLEQHHESFVRKAKAKGYVYADWDEGFMGAVDDDWAGLRGPSRSGGGGGRDAGRTAAAETMMYGAEQ